MSEKLLFFKKKEKLADLFFHLCNFCDIRHFCVIYSRFSRKQNHTDDVEVWKSHKTHVLNMIDLVLQG